MQLGPFWGFIRTVIFFFYIFPFVKESYAAEGGNIWATPKHIGNTYIKTVGRCSGYVGRHSGHLISPTAIYDLQKENMSKKSFSVKCIDGFR